MGAPWKGRLLLETTMFRGYVKLRGGILLNYTFTDFGVLVASTQMTT